MSQVIGGCLGIYMISWFFEWALTKRIFDDPVAGKHVSVAIAFPVMAIAYGFSTDSGTGFNVNGILIYGIAAAVIAPIKYFQGVRVRRDMETSLADRFS